MARDLIQMADSWRPDVVVRDRTEFGGAIAAEVLGAACVAVQVGNPSLVTPAVLAAIERPVNDARSSIGLGPDRDLARLEAQPILMFAPPGLTDPDVPLPKRVLYFRPAAYDREAGATLPDWALSLGRERPLVYATLGTVFNNPAFELPFFPALLDGLGEEPVDLVVTVGPNVDPAALGMPPENVRVERFIPQSLLFPRVSAVICHGGFGTVLAAIEHGVPLIVVPFGADQHLNAAAVERLQLGIAIDQDAIDATAVREGVQRILSDGIYRANIGRLRDEAVGLPTVAAAVEFIETVHHRR
jgi:UDP:flavonoid glycosyltransferase YjiC (YdhE family)